MWTGWTGWTMDCLQYVVGRSRCACGLGPASTIAVGTYSRQESSRAGPAVARAARRADLVSSGRPFVCRLVFFACDHQVASAFPYAPAPASTMQSGRILDVLSV